MPPPLPSMVEYLRSDQTLLAWTGGQYNADTGMMECDRIRGITMDDVDEEMFEESGIPVILVANAGGPHDEGYASLASPRFSIRCYAKTSALAERLNEEVFRVMQYGGKRRAKGNTVLSAQCESYGIPVREADTDWVYYVSAYLVELSTRVQRPMPDCP